MNLTLAVVLTFGALVLLALGGYYFTRGGTTSVVAPSDPPLQLCTDGAGGYRASPDDMERVGDALDRALDEASKFRDWGVTPRCPPPIPLEADALGLGPASYATPLASEAQVSEFEVWVYFVPANTFATAFGDGPYVSIAAESFCEPRPTVPTPRFIDTTCSTLTTAVYAPVSITPADLRLAVGGPLGLNPPQADPTFDLAACEQGTVVPGCGRYAACTTPALPDPSCEEDEFWESLGLEPPR